MNLSNDIMMQYEQWIGRELTDDDLMPELLSIQGDESEISERFAKNLEFGTGGLRGIIGAGTNRMNVYTVARATQGLALYIIKNGESRAVAIGFDSRIKSQKFAQTAAAVLAANGIKAYLYPELCPTPMVSYAVRELGCGAGIMVTASHNPAKYNGYKAYGSDGCQMTDKNANEVLAEIENVDIFDDVKLVDFETALSNGDVEYITNELCDRYYAQVVSRSLRDNLAKSDLKIVYTPLNGAGNKPVRHVLGMMGAKHLEIVEQQEQPDGHFPTCPYPNPESRDALMLGIERCKTVDADLLLATDPDCDRVGIAVKDADDYFLPSGNEIALLLLDYIIKARNEKGTMPKNPIFVKSVVTTGLAADLAKKAGVTTIDVLTGFKYIGEQILFLEQKGEEERFIFGCEESYGYLVGTSVRDKDAVVASMLLAEMAAYYADNNSSIKQALSDIYEQYGYEINTVESFEFEGLSGLETMAEIMKSMRANKPSEIAGRKVLIFSDYLSGKRYEGDDSSDIGLPLSNIVEFKMGDCCVIVRPSGTEPKIKIYYSATGKSEGEAHEIIDELKKSMKKMLK